MRVVGCEADIFSLGCVMYEVCELHCAYNSLEKYHVPRVSMPYDSCVKELIMDCMSLNTMRRPRPQQLAAYLDVLVTEKRNIPPGTRLNPQAAAQARHVASIAF
jgi:hypothetical protein